MGFDPSFEKGNRASNHCSIRSKHVYDIIHRASEVSITLKNEGEDAFKPDVYGKSITITRRFTKDSGSYKIKSREGKIVSTKREELSAILDHMNIQVDNPMNILSQGENIVSLWNYP